MDKINAAKFVTPVLFAVLSAVFAALTCGRLLRRSPGHHDVTGRVWSRLALIFALVSLFLFWFQSR